MNNGSVEVQDSKYIQKLIFLEEIKILHRNLFLSLPGNLLCAIIVYIGLFHKPFMNEWFTGVIIVTFLRFLGAYFHHSMPEQTKLHYIIFNVGVCISALLWAVLGTVLIPNDDPYSQMIVVIIIAGVTSGGVQTLNANLTASLIFTLVIILPLCIKIFSYNNLNYTLIGITISIYLLYALSMCIRGNKLMTNFLKLYFENELLVGNLSETNKRLKHQEYNMMLISKMNDLLQTCKEITDAHDVIIFTAKMLFPTFSGGLILYDPETKEMKTLSQWGDNKSIKEEFSPDDCWALRKERVYFVDYKTEVMQCKHFTEKTLASCCLPLFNQNGLIGLIVFHSIIESEFTDYQMQLAAGFSEVIQLSLINIKLREMLYKQTIHDHLTNLYNRRYIDDLLEREMLICTREQKPLSVAMIDLDKFKTFNDVYGHDTGDEVLKFIATSISEFFRETDIPCRYGGEEFLIVFVNSTASQAFVRLEEFRERIKNEKVYFNQKLLPTVTISIGIAQAFDHGSTASQLIKSADKALYLAKKFRDKTVLFQN